jgi:peptide/nickel transport system substrate-binding protein
MAGLGRRVGASWLAAVLALAGPCWLTSCSTSSGTRIDYAVDGALITYNANTVAGAASAGAQAFARTLTGFSYHGPDGQVVADRDFGTISVVGGAPLILDYQINDSAVYSDGKPVTCDDLVLAWAAGSGRYPAFDAASQAGYGDIVNVDCLPGQKKARVLFAPDRNIVAYDQLFSATTMMPSHVIADELGVDVVAALLGNDAPVVQRIARLWNTTWDFTSEIDPRHFPSSGPYKIESVSDDGAVVLVANDRWWGAKPMSKRIAVWPQRADIEDRVNNGHIDVVDVATGSSGSLFTPDDYERTEYPSDGIEQLIFAPKGPLADTRARRAVALCSPRDAIARDAAVPVANARLYTSVDDVVSQVENVPEAAPFTKSDPRAARGELAEASLTVRIGYTAPNARLAAIVGAIAKACAPAGIAVSDVSSDSAGPQTLKEGQIDVLLASTGGAAGSGSTGSSAMDAYDLHTDNGNNLSGFSNSQVDAAITAMAVSADSNELVRLLAESAPALWAGMPTLPLYRQQRTLLASKKLYAVSGNPTRWGAGWNMDLWVRVR